jgi:hypothetical protein
MPEAAMYEYDLSPLRKHDVRVTEKVCRMESVAVTHCMDKPSDTHLGLGVLARTNDMRWLRSCGESGSVVHMGSITQTKESVECLNARQLPEPSGDIWVVDSSQWDT